jgi:8-oxo-dGTP diphosphatase
MQFYQAPFRAPLRAFASLMFAWIENRVLLCNIRDRGWCIPSGRVELNESSREAAHRESMEEAGAELIHIDYIGCYKMFEKLEVRWADCFSAEVSSIGEITMPEESLGIRFATLDELPQLYHVWNPLTRMVFEHSYEILQRKRSN